MSSPFARFLGVAVMLGCASMFALAEDAEPAASINKQADDVSKKNWKELSKQGEALAKKHRLEDFAQLFGGRIVGPGGAVVRGRGLGVGRMPGAITPDRIDGKLAILARRPMEPQQLAKEQAELIRMAEHTAAIASVAVHQCIIDKKMGDKDPADWKKLTEQLHGSSLDMIKAIKAKKPADLRDAARKAYSTCIDCHRVFRDDA